VARLALQTGSPIIPVAMVGTLEAQPIGQVKPNLFMPITIRIGRPMRFDRFAGRENDPLVLRQITDEVMFELRELSGQEYVDRYAKRKADDPTGDSPVARVGAMAAAS
jgi:1-acyl-sn-glycerol-3-phosphate acyltransferase